MHNGRVVGRVRLVSPQKHTPHLIFLGRHWRRHIMNHSQATRTARQFKDSNYAQCHTNTKGIVKEAVYDSKFDTRGFELVYATSYNKDVRDLALKNSAMGVKLSS